MDNREFEYKFVDIVLRLVLFSFVISIVPSVAIYIIHFFYKNISIREILPDMLLGSVAVAGNILAITTDKEKNHDSRTCSIFTVIACGIMIFSLTTYIGVFVQAPLFQFVSYQVADYSEEYRFNAFAIGCLVATIINLIFGIIAERLSFNRREKDKK